MPTGYAAAGEFALHPLFFFFLKKKKDDRYPIPSFAFVGLNTVLDLKS